MAEKKGRVRIIDAVRGVCVVLMIMQHLAFDLVWLCDAPEWIFSNPYLDIFHWLYAGMFVFIAGISSRFSHSNLLRGVKLFAIAMGMTVVTSLPFIDQPIRFGVLHLLGACMIFYGVTEKALDELVPRAIAPVLWIALLIGSAVLVANTDIGNAAHWLFPFGWTYRGFYSSDYFPIFPWVFVYLLGTWAGFYIKAGRLPKWFYRTSVPPFEWIGRHALIIYIVHQPILYGLVLLVR